MRGDATRLALALFVLVVACAVEEAVPKAAGIGVPALLSFAIVFALRRPPLEGALFALAAGFAEGAKGGKRNPEGPSFRPCPRSAFGKFSRALAH